MSGRLLIGWMLVLAALGGTARGADGLPLSATPSPATLDKSGRVRIRITNGTALRLPLRVSVVNKDGGPVPRVSVTGIPQRGLAPGATFAAAVAERSGPVAGTLVVVAEPASGLPRGAVLRVALQPAAPVVATVSAWTVRDEWVGADQGRDLPLDGACAGLGFTGPRRVAVLQADGVSVPITASCTSDEASSLRLDAGAPPKGRSYSGTLTLGDEEIDLTVDSTWGALPVVGLIAIGIVLALGVTEWRGWGRTATQLMRRTWVVQRLVARRNRNNADAAFRRAAESAQLPDNVFNWTVATAVTRRLEAIRAEMRSWRAAPSDDDIANMERELDDLELRLRAWPDLATRLGVLDEVCKKRLQDLTKYVREVRSRTLDRQGEIDLVAMKDLVEVTDTALGLANRWPVEAISAAKELSKSMPGSGPAGELMAVLERIGSAEGVEAAEAARGAFWEVNQRLYAEKAAAAAGTRLEIVEEAHYGEEPSSEPASEPEEPDIVVIATGLGVRLWLVDSLVLLFLLAVAIVAGVQQLWVGEVFGGFWDVAAALVWGATAGAVAVPLSAALGNVSRSWVTSGAERDAG